MNEKKSNIAFTLCSNNYLAHAKTLGDSWLQYHPESTFIIGLVDKWNDEIDVSMFKDFVIVPVETVKIENFEELIRKYNISELNTAVKPSYFKYIFEKYNPGNVLYIDPDILVTSNFHEVFDLLQQKNIIITPHILSPVDDAFAPTDYHTLRGGVFNLGFIALSRYEKVKDFLTWWHNRVIKYGFANFALNMFYDQLWINYVPVFYDNYAILKHPGYNMANWNLHERQITIEEDKFMVNEKYPLRFFHFSSYKYNKPDVICSYQTRYNFSQRSDLVQLFTLYNNLLRKNNVEKISNTKVYYYPQLNNGSANNNFKSSLIEKLTARLKNKLS